MKKTKILGIKKDLVHKSEQKLKIVETTDKPHTNKICTLFQIKKDRKYLMKFFYLFSFPEILDFFQN